MKRFDRRGSLGKVLVLALVGGLASTDSSANLEPGRFFQADGKKTQHYITDGVVVGGDPAIQSVRVLEIRRAANAGYERLVVDLSASRADGELTAMERVPYYQVSVNPEEKRLIFTIWGSPKLEFQAAQVMSAFKKSAVVSSVELLPAVDRDRWSFVVNLKAGSPVEVFDLAQPARIITDIRLSRALPK